MDHFPWSGDRYVFIAVFVCICVWARKISQKAITQHKRATNKSYTYLTFHDCLIFFVIITSIPLPYLLFQGASIRTTQRVDFRLVAEEHECRHRCDAISRGCFLHARHTLNSVKSKQWNKRRFLHRPQSFSLWPFDRVPTLLMSENSRTFQDRQNVFEDLLGARQRINIL